MSGLESLPDEVLLDHILPILPLRDLLSVTQVSAHLARIAGDQVLWRRKISADFNLPPACTARNDGWKELYSALRRPSVYVFGASSNGRLGIPRNHPSLQNFHASYEGVNKPVRLPLDPGVGIVDIQASGYGFISLSSQGKVYCWGALDGSQYASRSNPDFTLPGAIAETPMLIAMPRHVVSVSCGRKHALLLDEKNTIWELSAWGRAIQYERAQTTSPDDPIVQLVAGWDSSCILTSSGSIAIWWPNPDTPGQRSALSHESSSCSSTSIDLVYQPPFGEISQPWYEFPPLPSGEKVVKIAVGAHFLVALTGEGNVWTAWTGNKSSEIGQARHGGERQIWEAHPKFSHPSASTLASTSAGAPKISHISAQFETFFAYSPGSAADGYSSSVVLKGKKQDLRVQGYDAQGATPEMIPELQGQGIIKVVVGDYHYGALTSSGKLLTWGAYSSGSLGLGQTRDVAKPQQVSFPDTDESGGFCFGVAAAGWHTGALVVNLDSSEAAQGEKAADSTTSSVKLAPTPSHPTLPDFPSTSRFEHIPGPPPSGRPIPGHPMLFTPGGGGPSVAQQPTTLGDSVPNAPGRDQPARSGILQRGAFRVGFPGRGGIGGGLFGGWAGGGGEGGDGNDDVPRPGPSGPSGSSS